MVEYDKAIKRPFTDLKRLLLGVLIQLIPVVNLIATGYHLRCAKTSSERKYGLPEWNNLGGMFVNGLLAVVIAIIYFLPAIVMLIIVLGAAFSAIIKTLTVGGFSIGALLGLGLGAILFMILFLIASYLLPSALVSFSLTEKFGDAFKLSVFRKVLTPRYLLTWIVMVIYSLTFTTIISVILSFTIILGPPVALFITGVTTFTAFGDLYQQS